jgi:hypothetical protein
MNEMILDDPVLREELDVLLAKTSVPAGCPIDVARQAAFIAVGMLTMLCGSLHDGEVQAFFDRDVLPFVASQGDNWPVDPIVPQDMLDHRLVKYSSL